MKYPFNVYQTKVEEHVFWIAEIPALNGCVGQGETADEALKELELNEETWLETAKEYGILLGTYSDHIAIDEAIRTEFFSKIEDAINNHGGTITIYDTIDLQLARKP